MRRELDFNQALIHFLAKLEDIPVSMDRKSMMEPLIRWIDERNAKNEAAPILFVCTHNSRRSILAEVLMNTLALYVDQSNVRAFSTGTEVTAFHPNAMEALKRIGFTANVDPGHNPKVHLQAGPESPTFTVYSKALDGIPYLNPPFAAVMVCTDAEENCPFIPGADLRVALPYTDPKWADNTRAVEDSYDKTVLQIASELYFALKSIGNHV